MTIYIPPPRLGWRERVLTELRGVGWKLLDEADVLYVENANLSFGIKQSCESIASLRRIVYVLYSVLLFGVHRESIE